MGSGRFVRRSGSPGNSWKVQIWFRFGPFFTVVGFSVGFTRRPPASCPRFARSLALSLIVHLIRRLAVRRRRRPPASCRSSLFVVFVVVDLSLFTDLFVRWHSASSCAWFQTQVVRGVRAQILYRLRRECVIGCAAPTNVIGGFSVNRGENPAWGGRKYKQYDGQK